jgi:catechol 2,3-dioxygenase-like lactoylglutathione lyase family enzyme|tara:strand:- start:1787 stop:2176 length:390 start_codon:yes stop_codon:yes gene_type:complete
MPYIVNHIHIKSKDPKVTAEWFVSAFNVKIVSDTLRSFGDRFVITETEGGLKINISSERTGETLGPADADVHYGIEHFGFDTADIKKDIERLIGLGAELKEGPIDVPGGPIIAFISAPGDIRIELIESR